MHNLSLSVIIPTLNAAHFLRPLLAGLRNQSRVPDEIFVVDSASEDGTADLAHELGCRVLRILRQEFDHGGTRQRAAELAAGSLLIFMTQDVQLASSEALQALIAPFADQKVAAVCGRQLPGKDANPLAAHARLYNYPAQPARKTAADIPRLGIRAAFLSNSFAAYRKEAFLTVGGFSAPILFGEDMFCAARLLEAGYVLAYAPQATVLHAHNYTAVQEFRRYFDMGVAHWRGRDVLARFGTPEGEGLRFLCDQLAFARRFGYFWVARSMCSSCCKYAGYRLGKLERFLPQGLKRRWSLQPGFWKNHE